MESTPRTLPRKSATFDDATLAEIRRAAITGIYDIRGAGAKRNRKDNGERNINS